MADKIVEKRKVEIHQQGGVYDSNIFELEDGRVAFMADIAVTNQTSRPIDVIDVELEAPWGEKVWHWLEPKQIKFHHLAKGDSFPLYRFPGERALELPYDVVINHVLVGHHRLPAKRLIDGFLLGISRSLMPGELRRRQWLDFSLAIIASDQTEYVETIQLPTDRFEAPPKAVAPRRSLFERDDPSTREGMRGAMRVASQNRWRAGSPPRSEERNKYVANGY